MEWKVQGGVFECKFTRMYIFEIWSKMKGSAKSKEHDVVDSILKEINDKVSVSIVDRKSVDKCVTLMCKQLQRYLGKYNRTEKFLMFNCSDWLETTQTFVFNTDANIVTPKRKRGRPQNNFKTLCHRSKQRRLAKLAKCDKTALETLRCSNTHSSINAVNIAEVISLITETSLTKHQYMVIRKFINSKASFNMLPEYKLVLQGKDKCYPARETTYVSETKAEISLQGLLDHTASRIVELKNDVLDEIESDMNVTLIGKWGFDGSSGYSEYKQPFAKYKQQSDSNLFVTSYVPLKLVTHSNDPQCIKTIWKNPRPSSTRYCSPIRFQFKKETKELCVDEKKYYQEKINNLKITECITGNKKISVTHNLQLTMVDGKVCNALSDTSSSKCYLCGAFPKEMNSIEACTQKPLQVEHLEFGLSPLHSYIRFFEYFLHISYRMDIKTWQVRSSDAKTQLLKRKRDIQHQFFSKMGLIVDRPKPGGSGNSNDGNTARRFFNNPKVSAKITGVKS